MSDILQQSKINDWLLTNTEALCLSGLAETLVLQFYRPNNALII